MSRKNRNQQTLTTPQIKHLRFFDTNAIEDGDVQNAILNNGGFTLAFRIMDLRLLADEIRAEWSDSSNFIVNYAWSECYTNDNFEAKKGRNYATARLNNMAPGWSHTFQLEGLTGEVKTIVRDANGIAGIPGEVDLLGMEAQVAKALITNFIIEQQPGLYNGADCDSFLDYLVTHRGRLGIDSTVLLTSEFDDDDDSDDEVEEFAKEGQAALRKLYSLLDFAAMENGTPSFTTESLEQICEHLGEISNSFASIRATHDQDDEDDEDCSSDGDSDDEADEAADAAIADEAAEADEADEDTVQAAQS